MSTQAKPTHHEPTALELEIAALKAENARLKANKTAKGTGLKVTEKGGVSFYGVGRFPVTLYSSQWETLLNEAETIKAFILANAAQLSTKAAKEA